MERSMRRWAREFGLAPFSPRRLLLGTRRRTRLALSLSLWLLFVVWLTAHTQMQDLNGRVAESSLRSDAAGEPSRGGGALSKLRAAWLRLQTAYGPAADALTLTDGLVMPTLESAPDAQCPPVVSRTTGRVLPPIPLVYEPRAPRALWMPPLPFTPDPDRPHSFNVDPATGKSNTRTVYRSELDVPPGEEEGARRLAAAGAAGGTDGIKQTVSLSGWGQQSLADSRSQPPDVQSRYPFQPSFSPRSLLQPEFLTPPPLSCGQRALRTRAYWHALERQQREQRPLNVLVWHGSWNHTTGEAKNGGPMGELGLFTSTMLALTALSANVTFLAHPAHSDQLLRTLPHYRSYDVILIDSYSGEAMQEHGYMAQADFRCRIRSLDYWGTPTRQNSWQLPDLRQYLVPFACTEDMSSPNTVLAMHRYANLDTNDTEPFRWDEEGVRRWDKQRRERLPGAPKQGLQWEEARHEWPELHSDTFAGTANTVPFGEEEEEGDVKTDGNGHGKNGGGQAAAAGSRSFPSVSSLFHSGLVRFPLVYAKRFQVLLIGKEARYFLKAYGLLRALAEVAPLLSVVHGDARGFFPSVANLPLTSDGHPRIRQLGVLDQAGMARAMRESALILGVGDPLLSFTPLEALRVGTPFLNPMFDPPKRYWMNRDCVVTSQHPYAERLGAPAVWNYDPRDRQEAQQILRTALKWVRQTQERYGGIPPLYPEELHYDQLVNRLNDNFRTDVCAANGLEPTPARMTKEARARLAQSEAARARKIANAQSARARQNVNVSAEAPSANVNTSAPRTDCSPAPSIRRWR